MSQLRSQFLRFLLFYFRPVLTPCLFKEESILSYVFSWYLQRLLNLWGMPGEVQIFNGLTASLRRCASRINPDIAPLSVHSNLWRHIEGGGILKYCIIGDFCSETLVGAEWGWHGALYRSCSTLLSLSKNLAESFSGLIWVQTADRARQLLLEADVPRSLYEHALLAEFQIHSFGCAR